MGHYLGGWKHGLSLFGLSSWLAILPVPLLLPCLPPPLQVLPRGGESMLSIGRLFGRIIQKGQNKKVEQSVKSAAKFWLILDKKGLNFKKIVYPLLSSLILGKFKKYYFPFNSEKYSVFLMPKFFQKTGNYWGPNFFPQLLNFSSGLADGSTGESQIQ
jgi:hypothetical protein